MARRLVACSFVLAVMGCTIPAAFAQDNLLDDLYGRGVHAYFSHEYQDAHTLLSEAIKSGSRDPRAYYFRGLTFARLGRPEEAKADIKMGSELEASGDTPVKVGRALERVQGPERLMIESSRKSARLAIRNAAEERAKIRYGERVRAEAAARGDVVLVDDAQGAEAHVRRIVVVREREGVARVEPAVVGVPALVASSHGVHDE